MAEAPPAVQSAGACGGTTGRFHIPPCRTGESKEQTVQLDFVAQVSYVAAPDRVIGWLCCGDVGQVEWRKDMSLTCITRALESRSADGHPNLHSMSFLPSSDKRGGLGGLSLQALTPLHRVDS